MALQALGGCVGVKSQVRPLAPLGGGVGRREGSEGVSEQEDGGQEGKVWKERRSEVKRNWKRLESIELSIGQDDIVHLVFSQL